LANNRATSNPIATASHISPGTKLFYCIKNYANNLFSLKLAEKDLNLAEKTPKQRNEFHRIWNTINYVQVNVKSNDAVSKQIKHVESAINKVTIENGKLSVLSYEAKSIELLAEIQSLMKHKLLYIPSSMKIMRYVKPNMLKRRFAKEIIPIVLDEIIILTKSLQDKFQSGAPNTVTKHNDIPTSPVPEMILNNNGTADERPTMDMDESFTLVENRKRKTTRPSVPSITPTTSDDELQSSITKKGKVLSDTRDSVHEVDLDRSTSKPKSQFKFKHLPKSLNVVKTAEEAFTVYKTYAPQHQSLPILANPPDTARFANLAANLSSSMSKNNEEIFLDTYHNSMPKQSLLTFHNNSHSNFPKTHISMKVTPSDLGNSVILDTIPSNLNMVYEILLIDNTLNEYKPYLLNFIMWAESRNEQFIFTIEEKYAADLFYLLPNKQLVEIMRPFQDEHYVCSTT
jgi:hypothetical protein